MEHSIEAFIDVDVNIKVRPKLSDVMTVGMALKSSKSSKMHKLKPRSVKRDKTKTKEAKLEAKMRAERRQDIA